MSLRELTKEAHKRAENHEFAKILFSGDINKKLYAIYLHNQYSMYSILEMWASNQGILQGLPDIRRSEKILNDFNELSDESNPHDAPLTPTTIEYINHIFSIKGNPKKLMAHVYVRHMGDLAGGQMIKPKVPGKGTYYDFKMKAFLRQVIRSRLEDDMVDEAIVCFDFAKSFFDDMMKIAYKSYLLHGYHTKQLRK